MSDQPDQPDQQGLPVRNLNLPEQNVRAEAEPMAEGERAGGDADGLPEPDLTP